MRSILGRHSLLWIMLALGSSGVQAQHVAVPEWCQASSTETLPALEMRRQALEGELALKKVPSPPAPAGPYSKDVDEALRKSQEQLLEVLFQIDCLHRAAAGRAALRKRQRGSPSPKAAATMEVTLYYATNRNRTGNEEPAKFYGAERESVFHYGRAVVSIPPNHTPGHLELPKLWKFERTADPSRHFVLKS